MRLLGPSSSARALQQSSWSSRRTAREAACHSCDACLQGLKVAVVEGGEVGGTCVNRGCVPSKALLAASGRVREFRNEQHLKAMGIQVRRPPCTQRDWRAGLQGKLALCSSQDCGAHEVVTTRGQPLMMPCCCCRWAP